MKIQVSPPVQVVMIFSAVFTVGFFILISPQLQPIGENFARLQTYSTAKPVVQKNTVSSTVITTKSEVVSALLPQENQLYDLSVQIEALAHAVPINLTGLTLNPAAATAPGTSSAQAKKGVVQLPSTVLPSTITISATGNYGNLQSFIEGLTRLKRYIQVQDMTLTSSNGGTTTAQITAITYNLPNASN